MTPAETQRLVRILINGAPPLTTAQVDTIRAALNRGSSTREVGIRQRPAEKQKAA